MKYVVVAAERIQAWLEATPRLRLMRGASQLLTDETHECRAKAIVQQHGGALAHDEAGNVAGVVVFTVPDEADALAAGRAVARDIAARLPLVNWGIWTQEGGNYVEAYEAHENSQRGPDVRFRPVAMDMTMVARCPGCGGEPSWADGQVDLLDDESYAPAGGDEHRPYGFGCTLRYDKNSDLREHWRRTAREADSIARPADNFEELAKCGGVRRGAPPPMALGRRDSRSHLGVIVADGNGMGAWFSQARRIAITTSDRGLLSTLSKRVDDAIESAVRAATDHITAADVEVLPVERQYVGGDDVLVSLPAVHAWEFAQALAAAFADHAVRDLARPLSAPTLSLGIAIAHRTHPFAQVRAQAEQALATAKQQGKGAAAWIGFRDLTVDGLDSWNLAPGRSRAFHTISLASIEAELGDSSTAGRMQLSAHAVTQLAALLRGEAAADLAAEQSDEEVDAMIEAVRRQGERTGVAQLIGEPDGDHRAWLAELQRDLIRRRWWPERPKPVWTPTRTAEGR